MLVAIENAIVATESHIRTLEGLMATFLPEEIGNGYWRWLSNAVADSWEYLDFLEREMR